MTTKRPASTNAPHPLATPEPPVKGTGVPMKVPLRNMVLLRIIVALLVGITNPTLAVVEELVPFLSPYPPSWEHGFGAYGSVIAAISNLSPGG